MTISPLTLATGVVSPPFFLAPMAGVTHSAFRRLVSDFGGHGALFTEMLSGRALLQEKIGHTPFTKKRLQEGNVWYQLALSGREDIPAVIDRLTTVSPFAIDLNAGCPAPEMEKTGTGAALFTDADRFSAVLRRLREHWGGILSVKCRLWKTDKGWKDEFVKRLRIIEDCGADAVFVHPRFFNEKLKRRARWELFPWICAQTRLPVIASGDVASWTDIEQNAVSFAPVKGIMIGRQAVVRPWLFRDLAKGAVGGAQPRAIDYAEVWKRYFEYVNEDFPPEKAIGRLKEFTKYYSCNFFFGHLLKSMSQGASSLDALFERAMGFLSAQPRVVARPSVSGI
jgi:tRNA-dihydrouridine synthase B